MVVVAALSCVAGRVGAMGLRSRDDLRFLGVSAVLGPRGEGAKSKDVKRPSHVPQGAVSKLEELITSFGLETATSQQFVSYQGSKYIMSDVLQLVNKTLQQPASGLPGEPATPGAGGAAPAPTAAPTTPGAVAAPVPAAATPAAAGAGLSTVGANGIFRLLNILFEEPMRQLWLECEKRTDGAAANGVQPGRWDPFWSYVTKLLLDPEHDVRTCHVLRRSRSHLSSKRLEGEVGSGLLCVSCPIRRRLLRV